MVYYFFFFKSFLKKLLILAQNIVTQALMPASTAIIVCTIILPVPGSKYAKALLTDIKNRNIAEKNIFTDIIY